MLFLCYLAMDKLFDFKLKERSDPQVWKHNFRGLDTNSSIDSGVKSE